MDMSPLRKPLNFRVSFCGVLETRLERVGTATAHHNYLTILHNTYYTVQLSDIYFGNY